MKKMLALVALASLPLGMSARGVVRGQEMYSSGTQSSKGDFLAEDRSNIGRLEAELKAKEQQYSRLQREISDLREQISRAESTAHVRAAESVKKTYNDRNQGSMASSEGYAE